MVNTMQNFCHGVSLLSTSIVCTDFWMIVLSFPEMNTVSEGTLKFVIRLPIESSLNCRRAFSDSAMSNQERTTRPFESHSSKARMDAESAGRNTGTSLSCTMICVWLSEVRCFPDLHPRNTEPETQKKRSMIKALITMPILSLRRSLQRGRHSQPEKWQQRTRTWLFYRPHLGRRLSVLASLGIRVKCIRMCCFLFWGPIGWWSLQSSGTRISGGSSTAAWLMLGNRVPCLRILRNYCLVF